LTDRPVLRFPEKLRLTGVRLGARGERRAVATVPRRRRLLGVVVVVVLVVLAVLIGGSGGQAPATPPATGAASIVPSGALAYIHVSTDQSRSGVSSALALAARFPGYQALRDGLLVRLDATAPGQTVNFARDVRPWLGKEVALAVLDTNTTTPETLIVASVANRAAAKRWIAGLPSDGTASYGGTTITGHPGALDTAFVGKYLVSGHSASIRAAIDVAAGHSPALSRDPSYRRASAGEPAGRAVDAYVSAAGVTQLLIARGGLLGVIGSLLYQPALQGLAISLTPAPGGLQVRVHSALDPQLAGASSATLAPSLAAAVPYGAALYLDVTGLNRILPRVLSTIGIGAQIPTVLKRLGIALTAQGVNVQQNILSLFRGESAVVITSHAGKPVVSVVVRTANESETRTVFAELQAPLARLFAQAGQAAGQSPAFNQVTVGGVAAHQLVLVPGLQFDYAVFGGKLVLSTSLDGIAGVAHHARSILDQPAYRLTLGNHPARLSSLLFLDVNQLLRLDEQTGLITGARFRTLKPDLERVHAIGLDSTSGEAESTAELFLQIP
jgi:hypothetical protein